MTSGCNLHKSPAFGSFPPTDCTVQANDACYLLPRFFATFWSKLNFCKNKRSHTAVRQEVGTKLAAIQTLPKGDDAGSQGVHWQYIPAADYNTPDQPAAEKVKMGLASLFDRFWLGSSPASEEEQKVERSPLREAMLDEILPLVSWEEAAANLQTTLDPRFAESPLRQFAQAVIGAPGSGVREVVRCYGDQVGGRIFAPPEPERLLRPDSDFWQEVNRDDTTVLVIPELERFYLRHADGLELIRQLMERLWHSHCPVIVGCDSWAWAYFCKVLRIDAVFRSPLVLNALDGDALWSWLRPIPRGRFVVRADWNDEVIFPIETGADAAKEEEDGSSKNGKPPYQGAPYFQTIAALSRGIPGVAAALWRKCLCDGEANQAQEGNEPKNTHQGVSIRVRALDRVSLPSLNSKAATREAVVLHTLLLHAGLSTSFLLRLVPFPPAEAMGTLSSLNAAGMVSEIEGFWSVPPLAYPQVRAFLKAETLLIDAF